MKITILTIILTLITSMALAKDTKKTVTLPSTVYALILEKNGDYRLDLKEHAAAYTASENFLPCLQKSLNEKKVVKLTVDPATLKVIECLEK